jgi:hypothetical protein
MERQITFSFSGQYDPKTSIFELRDCRKACASEYNFVYEDAIKKHKKEQWMQYYQTHLKDILWEKKKKRREEKQAKLFEQYRQKIKENLNSVV